MELRGLGRALQSERRRRAGRDDGRDGVEVAGPDLALVLGRGVAARLGGELGLFEGSSWEKEIEKMCQKKKKSEGKRARGTEKKVKKMKN